MNSKLNFLITLLLLFFHNLGFTQTSPVIEDSLKVYKDIENYSKKNDFTKFLHNLIFVPIQKENKKKPKTNNQVEKNYKNFNGKIIRNINVTVLDPFGNSITDSISKPKNFLEHTGNKLHFKTNNFTIRNLLLFKKNDALDTLILKDSKRILRSQKYIRRVDIDVDLISEQSDSVDLQVKVLDAWTTVPNFTGSTNKFTVELFEYNFLGLGHQIKNKFQKSLKNSNSAYSIDYIVPNILNTYISTTLSYNIDLDQNYNKGINIERPLISSFLRWSGGIDIGQKYRTENPIDTTLTSEIQKFKYNIQDYWLGKSFTIFKGNTLNDRTTNLIVSGRYFQTNYLEKASPLYDIKDYYSNEQLYLVGIGIASRQFKQEKLIFNYGIIEDVPIGIVYGFTGGYQRKNDDYRIYFGGRISLGKFYKWGFLSSNIEYGTFYRQTFQQTTFSLKTIYFTHLINVKHWKFRQFIKPEIIIGTNRIDSRFDKISLNDNDGIRGFNSDELLGTKKILFTLQTQGYSPWSVLGFRLNPFLSYTFGMLSNDKNTFANSKVYSQIGAGLIISNDYLVFDSFQVSISFFPNIPGSGNNIIKFNAFNTDDIGFQDFNFSKPHIVEYR